VGQAGATGRRHSTAAGVAGAAPQQASQPQNQGRRSSEAPSKARRHSVASPSDSDNGAFTPPTPSEDEAALPLAEQANFLAKMRRGLKMSFRRSSGGNGPPASVSSGEGRSTGLPAGSTGPPKPRSLRFTFSASNTSAKTAATLIQDLQRVLEANHVDFTKPEPFLLVCARGNVQFEMEVSRR